RDERVAAFHFTHRVLVERVVEYTRCPADLHRPTDSDAAAPAQHRLPFERFTFEHRPGGVHIGNEPLFDQWSRVLNPSVRFAVERNATQLHPANGLYILTPV